MSESSFLCNVLSLITNNWKLLMSQVDLTAGLVHSKVSAQRTFVLRHCEHGVAFQNWVIGSLQRVEWP